MGLLKQLFSKNKSSSHNVGINVKPLLDNINSEVESGIKEGRSVESVELKVDEIIDKFGDQLKDTLVAKLADNWVCLICETPNSGNSDICSHCNSKAGSFKCPNCGKAISPELEQCSCNYNCETWEQCTICERWYDAEVNKKCPYHT